VDNVPQTVDKSNTECDMPRRDGPIARLGWLIDGEWNVDTAGPNRAAADAVAVVVAEHFTGAAEAMLTGFLMLAEAVDSDPTNAALWHQYRGAEAAVREVATSGDDDEFSRLMAKLSAAVRDPEVAEP
jgi:hypothetical protein